MDRSKINQSELSYSSGAGFAKINLSTGRLLYEYYDVGIGNNLFNIDVSPVSYTHLTLPTNSRV